jgi:DNA-binding NarL/FixJ family response regulator
VPVTVYICDDVPELRDLMREALEADGKIQVVGQSGEAPTGIEDIRRLQPKVVLLDLALPGMDGLEALPKVEEAAPDAGIIVFSGFLAARMEPITRASGADRYLEKGSPLAELRRMVLELAAELDATPA